MSRHLEAFERRMGGAGRLDRPIVPQEQWLRDARRTAFLSHRDRSKEVTPFRWVDKYLSPNGRSSTCFAARRPFRRRRDGPWPPRWPLHTRRAGLARMLTLLRDAGGGPLRRGPPGACPTCRPGPPAAHLPPQAVQAPDGLATAVNGQRRLNLPVSCGRCRVTHHSSSRIGLRLMRASWGGLSCPSRLAGRAASSSAGPP